MVYGSEAPAKLPVVLTETERAVYSVNNLDSLELIGKLFYNAAVQPKEEKYRRVRLTNDKIKAAIVDTPGALDLMLALGWVQGEGEDADALIIPAGKFLSMKEVRMVEDQKDRARKFARELQVAALRARA